MVLVVIDGIVDDFFDDGMSSALRVQLIMSQEIEVQIAQLIKIVVPKVMFVL